MKWLNHPATFAWLAAAGFPLASPEHGTFSVLALADYFAHAYGIIGLLSWVFVSFVRSVDQLTGASDEPL